MVSFQTSRFGSLQVENDKIIHFPNGLLGFPEVKRYVLMDYKDTPLKWFQAVDEPDVAFIVAEPGIVLPGFNVELDAVTKQTLQLEKDEDLVVLVVLRVEDDRVIANLKGPLMINSKLMLGVQAVVNKN
jgi:flagellar assembly factor FliW